MNDYNNPGHYHAAQNTYTGSNMTNTVPRTPQRRIPNTAYDGHDSGQQQYTVNANHDSYAGIPMVNNPSLGRGMEIPHTNVPYAPNPYPTAPGLPADAQYYVPVDDVPVQTDICNPGGQVSRQSLSRYPQMPPAQLHLPQAIRYSPTQCDINDANDAWGASRHAVGATAVRAALPAQQARRQPRVKTSRPTASHDVADSNTAVDCNNNQVSEYDKNTEYSAADRHSDKDSKDLPEIRKQKRQKKSEEEECEIDPKTGKPCKISNSRESKRNKSSNTMPQSVYGDFEDFRLQKGITLKVNYHSKHMPEEGFGYNEDGQLMSNSFCDEDIRGYVKSKIDESEVTPFTMWIQSAPCQASNRMKKGYDNTCRRKECPANATRSTTIRPGEFRVAFDEFPYFTENGYIDPLKPALVLHLWCFESVFSREETQKYLADGFLKGDTRRFAKEDRNIVTLEKDSKRHSRNVIEEWRKATDDEQKAIALGMIDFRNQADAKDDNSDNDGCEFYQARTYSPGHLTSLTFALSAWHADMNIKYSTKGGKGTRPNTRKDRNKKLPKGIRNTLDYNLGDVESYAKIKEKQDKYKRATEAAPEQPATAKQEDMEHRDSFNDLEKKLLQARADFNTAQKVVEAAEEQREEAQKKLDDAQKHYDEAKVKREAEKHVEPEGHVPKKKATKKKGKRNDPAAQTAAEEASESLETAKGDCRRVPKERRSAKDTDEVEEFQSSVQQSAKSHVTARTTNDLGERRGDEPSKENSESSYIDADYDSHSPWQCPTGANGDFKGEFPFPGTGGQGELADMNMNWLDLTGENQTEWNRRYRLSDINPESPSIVLKGEDTLFSQGPMDTTTPNGASMASTPMLTAWAPQSRVLEEASESDEDRPLRVKQEPSQQRSLQELPDYNSGGGDPRTMPSRVAAPRKRGQQQIPDYNDAEKPASTKRAHIAAPQQVSNAAAACHTPSYGPNRPARNKRRADGDLDDSFHKRMCQ